MLFFSPAGAVVDAFGDYKYMFLECGAIMVFAGVFLLVGNFYNYRMLRKEAEAQRNEEKKEVEMKEGVAHNKHDYNQVATDEKAINGMEIPSTEFEAEKLEEANGSGPTC